MGDIYCLFYEQGYKLLNCDGLLSYITSNKWMRAGYGEALRNFLATQTNPLRLIDFAGHKIFDSATVDVNILTYEKGENKGNTLSCTIQDNCLNNLSVYIEQNSSVNKFCVGGSWSILSPIESSIKLKIESMGIPLKDWNININYGLKTGFNEAFIISEDVRNELIAADPKSAEIIRPILRGRDIKRYACEFANLWIIATHNGLPSQNIPPIDIEKYPAVKAYLDQYLPQLKKRLDQGVSPYNLRSCAYMDDFSKQKIVWGEISDNPKFSIDTDGRFYLANTVFFMNGESLTYLLGFLNSHLSKYYFSTIATTTGVGTTRWLKYKIEALPIPQISKEDQALFVELVDLILESISFEARSAQLDQQLNTAIYGLYGFTEQEVAVIEGRNLVVNT